MKKRCSASGRICLSSSCARFPVVVVVGCISFLVVVIFLLSYLELLASIVHRSISPANSRRFRPPFVTIEVALDSSQKALSSHTNFGGCRWLEQKHEVAVFVRVFCCSVLRHRAWTGPVETLALLFTTAECDDITADVIIADSRFLLALCLDPTADSDDVTADAKRCRINLFKRHRFAIANFEYARLVALKLATDCSFCMSSIYLLRFSSSADYDVVTDDIIFDGPLRCSSWFPFDVPAGSSSSSSACSWFLSFQLIHFAPAAAVYNDELNQLLNFILRTIDWTDFATVHLLLRSEICTLSGIVRNTITGFV
ncbi:mitogen-activated protein kinase kinase kinase 1-like [Dorcoceras hygrometricum]|uniref:Mitogen-activated protein kinase kinase kinase 1-like n=1 Tax=Dorcoceras hygrometricum TaxID=472368 RepID=A0A2Z7AHZ8_9LAMI|nr:mitogen-activated protein kinase kinase kinase 1-like [Dorcoceras hygrometricum]